jgi:hypothetical protein
MLYREKTCAFAPHKSNYKEPTLAINEHSSCRQLAHIVSNTLNSIGVLQEGGNPPKKLFFFMDNLGKKDEKMSKKNQQRTIWRFFQLSITYTYQISLKINSSNRAGKRPFAKN